MAEARSRVETIGAVLLLFTLHARAHRIEARGELTRERTPGFCHCASDLPVALHASSTRAVSSIVLFELE